MPEEVPSTNAKQAEAEQIAKLLELELLQKRAAWKQAGARRRNARAMSFAFLFLIIVGCLAGLFFAFSMVNDERPKQQDASTPVLNHP